MGQSIACVRVAGSKRPGTDVAEHDDGHRALGDKSYMVRYRACMVLAYSLRVEAIPALQRLLQHADPRTREDAARALDAIHHQNHHYFVDHQHSGRSFWVVNESDESHRGPSR